MSQSPNATPTTPDDQAAVCATVCKTLVMLAAAQLERSTGFKSAAFDFVESLNRGETVVEFIVTLRPDHGRLLATEYRMDGERQLERLLMETRLVAAQPGQAGPAWMQ